MKIRNSRSIIVILAYAVANIGIIVLSFMRLADTVTPSNTSQTMAPDYTYIEDLDYFHLKNGIPQLSLAADKMKSQGEDIADFEFPKGVYNHQEKDQGLRYQGRKGRYEKKSESIVLRENVKMTSEDSEYHADFVKFFFKKDLVIGKGSVKFLGEDLKSKDRLIVESDRMRAHPNQKLANFKGGVKGSITRKKKYEGKMEFTSKVMDLDGMKSLAQLEGDVWLKRGGHVITAGKGDIYLENFNKSLKYFVFNDDVKVSEKLVIPQGVTQRKAFSERLEGFGSEQKMILSGAPRVETGEDVIKGYRITIRENVDLVEVDDAMSDVHVKRKDK